MGFSGVSWAADFVHLHVASAYSLRYGVASPAALVARAAQDGMRALALTDRDGLYGAVKHAVACAEAGLATILGADLALAGASGVLPAGAVLRRVPCWRVPGGRCRGARGYGAWPVTRRPGS